MLNLGKNLILIQYTSGGMIQVQNNVAQVKRRLKKSIYDPNYHPNLDLPVWKGKEIIFEQTWKNVEYMVWSPFLHSK